MSDHGWRPDVRDWLRRSLRPMLVTAVAALAATIVLYPFLENRFLDLLISAEIVGFTLLALLRPAMLRPLPLGWRIVAVTGALAGGAFVGTVLVVLVKGRDLGALLSEPGARWPFLFTIGFGMLFGLISVVVMAVRMRIARAEAEVLRVEAERQALARRHAEAELMVVRAQIEPHFLINTLSNLAALIQHDPPQALAMLENLIDYLQAALPRIRGDSSHLRSELAMTSAYVAILQIRMGARLQAQFDVPGELLAWPVPPLTLLTLVENAITHGLNPAPAGGTVWVSARREQDKLVLCVADDGVGLDAPQRRPGQGVGLSNMRERLRAMYGDQAALRLAPRQPRGTLATIELPGTFPASHDG